MSHMIATVGDTHACPMFNGTVPHVGGTIITGSTKVLLNNKGVARMGDKCICTGCGTTCIIIQGCPSVLAEGKPVAFVGCMTSHGGVITSGQPNAFLMAAMGGSEVAAAEKLDIITMPIEMMPPFAAKTYTAYLNKIANNKKSNEADKKEEELKANGYLVDVEFSF